MKETNARKDAEVVREPAVWLVSLDAEGVELTPSRATPNGVEFRGLARLKDFPFALPQEGDLVGMWETREGEPHLVAVGRVLAMRWRRFDGILRLWAIARVEGDVPLSDLGLDPRVDRRPLPLGSVDPATLTRATGHAGPDDLPLVRDEAYVRDLLHEALVMDLLGPAGGPYEIVEDTDVRDRYLVGKLAPRSDREALPGKYAELPEDAVTDPEDQPDDQDVSGRGVSLFPSSIGMTFEVEPGVDTLVVEASWGSYEKVPVTEEDKEAKIYQRWRRYPRGGRVEIDLRSAEEGFEPMELDEAARGVRLHGIVRPPTETGGSRVVTLFLVNDQVRPRSKEGEAWVFQPEIVVRSPDGRPVFKRRPVGSTEGDRELRTFDMLYREYAPFAMGHGVATRAVPDPDDPDHAIEVATSVMPAFEVPRTDTPGTWEEDRPVLRKIREEGSLDMRRLAEADVSELFDTLSLLVEDYRTWIAENRERAERELPQEFEREAQDALDRAERIADRIEEGIRVLKEDDRALRAFRLANEAMALQRIHSVYAKARRKAPEGERSELRVEDYDRPENRTWRPFQLAFLLLGIPSLADPLHPQRTDTDEAVVDLLWFPTGGGKTEAYLGLAAFAMFVRRLQGTNYGRDGTRGLTVLMRYTLRLLTIQQFQRASTLICALEDIRRRDRNGDLGEEPFTIGLWVGQRVTPNTTSESAEAVSTLRAGNVPPKGSPAQLTSCPWCGSPIDPRRDIRVETFREGRGMTTLSCPDPTCAFNERNGGLPVRIVDDETYRRPPSLLVATVDKFALMAWKRGVSGLFGNATDECPRHGLIVLDEDGCTGRHRARGEMPATDPRRIDPPIRPPDLVIQDELHLISGPLGTMVGLYETAVDELSSWTWEGKKIRPKVVASTATVRRSSEQVKGLFAREVSIFPAHGIDARDDYFSIRRPLDRAPGRRYVGLCAHGSSRPAALIRIYTALLGGAQYLYERFGEHADPYMTLVGYFSSLRELGGMRRLVEDDVHSRLKGLKPERRPGLAKRFLEEPLELTSRVRNQDIPLYLDELERPYVPRREREHGMSSSPSVLLATNMLSVGVDVDRLGLMAVNGQPKHTAEYIQATSRVGRRFPGLVVTLFNWARPRDLSHYESFEYYHATFYRHVEPQSVTPFAPRALDRGLPGAFVSRVRHSRPDLSPNEGASLVDGAVLNDRAADFTDRAKVADPGQVRDVESFLKALMDAWLERRDSLRGSGAVLKYVDEKIRAHSLLTRSPAAPGIPFAAPLSMREVEDAVGLRLTPKPFGFEYAWTQRGEGEVDRAQG